MPTRHKDCVDSNEVRDHAGYFACAAGFRGQGRDTVRSQHLLWIVLIGLGLTHAANADSPAPPAASEVIPAGSPDGREETPLDLPTALQWTLYRIPTW